jgi:hypothetical protein
MRCIVAYTERSVECLVEGEYCDGLFWRMSCKNGVSTGIQNCDLLTVSGVCSQTGTSTTCK